MKTERERAVGQSKRRAVGDAGASNKRDAREGPVTLAGKRPSDLRAAAVRTAHRRIARIDGAITNISKAWIAEHNTASLGGLQCVLCPMCDHFAFVLCHCRQNVNGELQLSC